MLFNVRNEIFYETHPVKFCLKLHKSYIYLQALTVGMEDYYMQLIVLNSHVALLIKKLIFHSSSRYCTMFSQKNVGFMRQKNII